MDSRFYAAFFLLLVAFQSTWVKGTVDINLQPQCREVAGTSAEKVEFSLNLLIYEAEFYLRSSIGRGIDDIFPGLVQGPQPIGAIVANLDPEDRSVIEEFGYGTVGNIKAFSNNSLIRRIVRPQIDISVRVLSEYINAAFGRNLTPPFNSYANTTNYFGTISGITDLVQQYFVFLVPRLVNNDLQRVANGILGSVSQRAGALRALGYLRVNETVQPYEFTVGTLSSNQANLLNRVGNCGDKNLGLVISGAENPSGSNVVPGDVNSLSFSRSDREVLRIAHGNGNASRPGGIFPNGFNGAIARRIRISGLV